MRLRRTLILPLNGMRWAVSIVIGRVLFTWPVADAAGALVSGYVVGATAIIPDLNSHSRQFDGTCRKTT